MSGLIPQACIDDILQRTDLIKLIDEHIPLKKQGRNYLACCPFHEEKTPSFNVIPKKQFYYCFGCAASGNAISFLMQYLHVDFVKAVETLAIRLGIEVNKDKSNHTVSPSYYDLLDRVNAFYHQQLQKPGNEGLIYLQKRGLSITTIKRYQLGFAPAGWHHLEHAFARDKQALIDTGMLVQTDEGKIYDRYRHRLLFPVHDRQGKIIGFGGRVLNNDDKPKYLNSPETPIFQKNQALYGLYQIIALDKPCHQLIVVEGYLDVLVLAEHGICNAVATLGTATSTFHIQLLHKYAEQIIFCFDGDAAGRKAAWRALEQALPQLQSQLDLRFVFLENNHDPDSFIREHGKAAFIQCIEKSVCFVDYFIATLTENLSPRTVLGKSQILDKAKPYLNQIPAGSYRTLLIDAFAKFLQVDSQKIDEILSNQAAHLEQPDLKEQTNPQKITRSPIRMAIALVLQDPSLGLHMPADFDLSGLTLDGVQILETLIRQIKENPTLNTPAILERWRSSPFFEGLHKLAAFDHLIPEANRLPELLDIFHFLQKKSIATQINQLIEQSKKRGLTQAEQVQLQTLVKRRHQKEL